MKCIYCDFETEVLNTLAKHIRNKHKDIITWDKYKVINNIKTTNDKRCNVLKSEGSIIDPSDKHQCQICGYSDDNSNGIGRHVLAKHKIKPIDYYNKYFGKVYCKWCNSETKFNSINHGYEEFCRECMFKSRHPTQDLYWKRIKGIENQDEIKRLKKEWQNKNNPLFEDYYLSRGFTQEETIEKVLQQRQKNNNIFKNNVRNNFSKISQEMFKQIYSLLPIYIKEMKIYFATFLTDKKEIIDCDKVNSKRNNEYLVFCRNRQQWKKLGKSGTALDFYIKDLNLIIEFDGTYWHNDNFDKIRDEVLTDILGNVKIIHIKEKDYNLNKQKVIENILILIERVYNERNSN